MPPNLENSAWPQDWKRSVFIPIPKKGQCQRMFKLLHNYTHFTCYQGHAQNLQVRLQQYMNQELPDVQDGFRKGKRTRDQIANICWITEKPKRIPGKHLLLLHWLCFDCEDHNKSWKILKEMGMSDHLTSLLGNLYADQEATVRTGHGTTTGLTSLDLGW